MSGNSNPQSPYLNTWLAIACFGLLLNIPIAHADDITTEQFSGDTSAITSDADDGIEQLGLATEETETGLQNLVHQIDDEPDDVLQTFAVERATESKPKSVDFWRMMRDGFSIPTLNSNSVASLSRLYSNNPQFLTRSMQRASPYIHEIISQLKYRGMPTDLALLPVIESSYDPRALSPAAAAGIWQFIPETGKRYGLRQDWLRDERRDPMAATRAALDYLKFLHGMFGDWHLALAGYNCGENCVLRAIARSRAAGGGRDFGSISAYLPQETRDYVPRFIAVRNVFKNMAHSGVHLSPIHHNPRITGIVLNHPVDLASVANLAGMSFQELKTLNAGVLRQVVPSSSGLIWITEDGLERLKTKLAKAEDGIDEHLLINLKAARANRGESLYAFAARHGISTQELRAINNIHPSLNIISSGTLFVPRGQDESPFTGETAKLSPLVMVGEQALNARIKRVSTSKKQLTAHPIVNSDSGWMPGRLKVSGSRYKSRAKRLQ